MKMRGEREQACLDFIRKNMFINHFVTDQNYMDASDEDFFQNESCYTVSGSWEHFYGMNEEEIKIVENALRTAMPNQSASSFPDFLFKGGFIERFEITSSETSNKGSKQRKTENEFDEQVQKEIRVIQEEINKNPVVGEVKSYHWENEYPEHSYENLQKSFHQNFEHHLERVEQYQGEKEIKIFMIHYPDLSISTIEDLYKDIQHGIHVGDLREQQSFQCYRLSRDKEMLNYLYQFNGKIDYIIFLACNAPYEIIGIKHIPEMLKLLPWDFRFFCAIITHWQQSLYTTSIPKAKQSKEENENDQT